MKKHELLTYLRSQKLAVVCTASWTGTPASALVGVALSDEGEIVFDTLRTSRKVANVRHSSKVSFVIGGWAGGDERTVQYEGTADFPEGQELLRLKAVYFSAFPEGRQRESNPQIVYVRAKPSWVRYSDFNQSPPIVHEFTFNDVD